ncbi:interferon gamma receptor 1 isoform X1 [Anguilla anguilla]|uniref:interferon gamma receptor 1 isoform X1 n=1 Tax=Anguilla anguilla TaxID=7936 RepID=UPI0015B37665|nr:interferon gamma receptor 1 isoform X1 [Anguilla anguilla]
MGREGTAEAVHDREAKDRTGAILWIQAEKTVPAPFDLKLSCHNFETVVYWNYKNVSLRPRFRVQILKDINNADSETTETSFLRQDISSFVTHIYDSYYVNVSAMKESEISTSAVSPQFSYRKDLPAEVRCTLDFPNVTLSVKDGQITFTFSHPYQVYKDTPMVKKLNGCEECNKFKYSVSYNETDTYNYECLEEVCKETFHIPGNSDQHCISLSGTELKINSGRICQCEETQISWIYFIFVSVCIVVAGAFVLIVIGVIVFMRTTKTMPLLPKTLVTLGFKKHPENTMMPKDYNGQIAWPFISPKTLLLSPKEVVPADSPNLAAPEEGSRFPIGEVHLEEWSSNQEATHLLDLREPCHKVCSDQSRQWEITREEPTEDYGGSPPYGNFSGYDRPQVLEVEISPGDIVHGYGPRDHDDQMVF